MIRSKSLSPDNSRRLAIIDTRPCGVVEPSHGMNQRFDLNDSTIIGWCRTTRLRDVLHPNHIRKGAIESKMMESHLANTTCPKHYHSSRFLRGDGLDYFIDCVLSSEEILSSGRKQRASYSSFG